MIGLRNIIRATTGVVEPFGHDLGGIFTFMANEPSLSNFRMRGCRDIDGLVGYEGGRAKLHATTSYQHDYAKPGDVSTSYPVNNRATEILRQPCTKRAYFDPNIPVFGDAVLITDRRYHWVLPKDNSSDDDFAALDALLTTPRTVCARRGKTVIVFLEEPNQNDIVYIMLARQ
jgi:hypothetical protein